MADAYLVPFDHPKGLHDTKKLNARNAEFGPLLGGVKNVHNTQVFLGGPRVELVTAEPHPTYFFPHGHLQEGQDRYTWEPVGKDGVLAGTLVADKEKEKETDA